MVKNLKNGEIKLTSVSDLKLLLKLIKYLEVREVRSMARSGKEPSNKTKERYDLFVDCYLQTFNATQSAIKVGYSQKTARQQGHKLLTNAYIKEKFNWK